MSVACGGCPALLHLFVLLQDLVVVEELLEGKSRTGDGEPGGGHCVALLGHLENHDVEHLKRRAGLAASLDRA